jgi:GntR family transcriptional repressor for pyruvate dehydrogenase complex
VTEPTFSAIRPGANLAEQVADMLEQKIRTGQLAEGEKLPSEARLVNQFEVSRTVVREAISRLKSLGLVEARQGAGMFVRRPSLQPLDLAVTGTASRAVVLQIVEVRRALEAEVAELAALRRDETQLAAILAARKAIDEAVAAGRDGTDEDVRFHRAIAEAAGNPFLIRTLDYLSQLLRGATRVTRANEARRHDFARAVNEEHERIVAAIAAGDSTGARQAAARHMVNAASRIEQADATFWRQHGERLARELIAPDDLPAS